MKLVAYYRVSTKRQGATGYGLDAQRDAVSRYAKTVPDSTLIAEFTEVESGTKTDAQRPQLAAAIERCRLTGASLVVAKLDRLARNASFLHRLRDSGIEFICCDMPNANRLTIGILAEVAESEVATIRARTKAGIAEAIKRGVKWGAAGADRSPEHVARMTERSVAVRSANRAAKLSDLTPLVSRLHVELGSHAAVAERLNTLHIRPLSGTGTWDRFKVLAIIKANREKYDV